MTTHRIYALPLQLANQIAAGEVVERPASVLKELVENSIDAGANQIDILIEGAGRQLIQVTDNGQGIHKDDLTLALSRHATSKLHSSDQLSQIASLGFRGEALPSIASVSRLTLVSKQAEMDCAWQLTSDTSRPAPASHPNGTTVSVAELFFNLPARRHFLRSDKTELHHLQTTFHRLALSRFDIGFSARFNQQPLIRLPAITAKENAVSRIAKICGQAFLRDALYLQQQYDDIELHGWISQQHRAQTDVQYFFINGRVIRDKLINHAIRLAYDDRLPAGRQAAYVLYLTVPLNSIDVNVHPTKHEVRFRDARLIHGLISRAIIDALTHPSSDAKQTSLDLSADNENTAEVTENLPSYSYPTPSAAAPATTAYQKNAAITPSANFMLLHNRYALFTSPPALVDVQQLAHQQRSTQLHHAILTSTVATRAILVPVSHPVDKATLTLLQQHQRLLEACGIVFTLSEQTIRLRRIPYLLSSIELDTLLHILATILTPETQRQSFAQALIDALPLLPIPSLTQAQELLTHIDHQAEQPSKWYRTLDSTTLADLFSD